MKVIKEGLLYWLSVLVILQCNTLIVHVIVNKFFLILIFGVIIALFLFERKFIIEKEKMYLILIFLLCMSILFAFSGFKDIEFVFTIVSSFVLFCIFFDNWEKVLDILEIYTNIMLLISAISLFFFVFASLLNWIEPTAYYSHTEIGWGNLDYDVFYHLYCEGQTISAFGYEGIRNTAIFVEAPMFVYPLTIAVYYELFLRKEGYRKSFIVFFLMAMLTSFSTTGLLALVVMLYLKFYGRIKGTNFSKYVVTPCLVVIAVVGAVYIFYDKVVNGSHSVSVRGDDIVASIKCFFDNPILGVGFENMAELNSYGTVEKDIPSLSTGMGAVFAFGGVILGAWYSIPLIVAVYKYIFYLEKRNKMGLVVLTSALFCVTIVQTRVLCTMMNAINWLIVTEMLTVSDNIEKIGSDVANRVNQKRV